MTVVAGMLAKRTPRLAAILLIDLALVGGCAMLLWNGGGTTVANGSLLVQAACFILAALLLTARHTIRRHRPSRRLERLVAAIHLGIITLATAAWVLDRDYFLGWICSFAAFTLLITSLCQLLSDMLSSPKQLVTRRERRINLIGYRIGTTALAVGALIALTPIHAWDASILSAVVILIGGAILLSVVLATWFEVVLSRSPRSNDRRTRSV